MNIEQERIELLKSSADQRRRGVMHYQVDIDNYRAAIAEIEKNYAADKNLMDFANHLRGLLKTNIDEQAKERIILTVIERQLEDMKCLMS